MVTAILHSRLMLEIAIRQLWVKAPITQRNRLAISNRLRRVIELDIQVLLSADDAVQKHAGYRLITNRDDVKVDELLSSKSVQPAPRNLETLANEAGVPALYGVFRYLSTLAHPGFGQKLAHKVPPSMYWQYLRYAHACAALHGVALLDGLELLEASADLPLNEAAFQAFGRLPES